MRNDHIQTGKRCPLPGGRYHRVGSWFAVGVAPLVLLLGGGCTPESRIPYDPLTGGGPLIPPAGVASPAVAQNTPSGGVPPLHAPTSSGSVAALASGQGLRSLDPARELRIGEGTGTAPPAPNAWGGRGEGWAKASGVALRDPQPIRTATGPVALEAKPAPPIQPVSSRPVEDYQYLRRELESRGATNMRLDIASGKGLVKFSCWVQDRRNPNNLLRYEAEAPDELAAMRAALDKLESDR